MVGNFSKIDIGAGPLQTCSGATQRLLESNRVQDDQKLPNPV